MIVAAVDSQFFSPFLIGPCSGLPITLTLGFCFATVAILMLDTEESCSRIGVLKRVPENELSTPEEFLAAHAEEAA